MKNGRILTIFYTEIFMRKVDLWSFFYKQNTNENNTQNQLFDS